MGIEFLGAARDDDPPSVRDCYDVVARAHLWRNGIKLGRRGWDRLNPFFIRSVSVQLRIVSPFMSIDCVGR